MVVWQRRSKRKVSGGRFHKFSKKRKANLGRSAGLTKVGDKRAKTISTMGGNEKRRLLKGNEINVTDYKTKKMKKAKIVAVAHNPASRHYARMNVITKGAIVELENESFAKVTNRPGQDGVLNGIKVDYESPKKKKSKSKKK